MNDIFEYLVIYILNFCRFFLIFHMITFDLLIEINFQYIFLLKKKNTNRETIITCILLKL